MYSVNTITMYNHWPKCHNWLIVLVFVRVQEWSLLFDALQLWWLTAVTGNEDVGLREEKGFLFLPAFLRLTFFSTSPNSSFSSLSFHSLSLISLHFPVYLKPITFSIIQSLFLGYCCWLFVNPFLIFWFSDKQKIFFLFFFWCLHWLNQVVLLRPMVLCPQKFISVLTVMTDSGSSWIYLF